MTAAGMILGTAAYMSPEQAKGKPADKRSDIWAFGCVLYEMLTGERSFQGDDVAETLASIIRAEPDWGALPPALDERVAILIRRCLDRNARQRRQSIADIRVELEQIAAEPTSPPKEHPTAVPSRVWPVVAGVLAVLLLIVAGLAWSRARTPQPARGFANVAQFSIPIPADMSLSSTGRQMLAIAATDRESLTSRVLGSMSETSTAPRPGLSNRHVRPAVRCRASVFAGRPMARVLDSPSGWRRDSARLQ